MKCLVPFKSLSVSIGETLRVSPCCVFPGKAADKIDFYRDINLRTVRNQWRDHSPPKECNTCFIAEQQSGTSRRIGTNKWLADHGFVDDTEELICVDYWVGNLCNLKCVICGPSNSTAWQQELGVELINNQVNINWKQIDLSKVQLIHFNGGEPLLSKEHVQFLENVPNKSQVVINYNTNGTIRPSDSLLSLWEQFKLVVLDFSIDDIGDRYNYQRYPADWETVCINLEWFKKTVPNNCMFGINTTLNVLNYHTIDDLRNWVNSNFYENRLGDPINYREQPAIGILSISNRNVSEIIEYLDGCDNRRGTNWRLIFPKATNFLNSKSE